MHMLHMSHHMSITEKFPFIIQAEHCIKCLQFPIGINKVFLKFEFEYVNVPRVFFLDLSNNFWKMF